VNEKRYQKGNRKGRHRLGKNRKKGGEPCGEVLYWKSAGAGGNLWGNEKGGERGLWIEPNRPQRGREKNNTENHDFEEKTFKRNPCRAGNEPAGEGTLQEKNRSGTSYVLIDHRE